MTHLCGNLVDFRLHPCSLRAPPGPLPPQQLPQRSRLPLRCRPGSNYFVTRRRDRLDRAKHLLFPVRRCLWTFQDRRQLHQLLPPLCRLYSGKERTSFRKRFDSSDLSLNEKFLQHVEIHNIKKMATLKIF